MFPTPSLSSTSRSPELDEQPFLAYTKEIGKAYQTRALELIFLCRLFARTHKSSIDAYSRLRNALQVVDDALKSAIEAGTKTSKEADMKFERAINVTRGFKDDLPCNSPISPVSNRKRVETLSRVTATTNPSDKSRALLEFVKDDLFPKQRGSFDRTRVVEFVLLGSLLDKNPIIVKQVLNESPSLQEILWNFSRIKDKSRRLTLKQNPHFYVHLPTSPDAYSGDFNVEPVENFRHPDKFYVLTDRPGLVYMNADPYSRCFGNFWCPNGAIIFKDLGGRLEGEAIVKASLKSTLWRFCSQPLTSASPRPMSPGHGRDCQPTLLLLECPCENWKCQIGSLPASDDISFGVCAGRTPLNSPLQAPLPPTSKRPQYSVAYNTHIHVLNDDLLIEIFNHCRLGDVDNWNLRRVWCKLAHVCQRWRLLIYELSSFLGVNLLLTNGSIAINSLDHLRPLPLVIDYWNKTTTRAWQDEGSILAGLRQHHRVRRVALQAPSLRLRNYLVTMSDNFPVLEDLSLLCTTEGEETLVLPHTLQAPNLGHLSLQGIGLPIESPLFAFTRNTTTLITLTLTRIPPCCYFPPAHLVTQIQGLPHLEELSIGFAIPIPLPSTEGELLPAPTLRVTLPTLKRLLFRGVSVYLENLVAQIKAPLLQRLTIRLFFELTFTLMNLAQFVQTTEGLRCLSVRVLFNGDGASVVTSNGELQDGRGLTLNVGCEPLDWQIDSATQMCGALGPTAVEELTLDLDGDGMPSDWESSLDRTLWHRLLLPFSGVKKLRIGSALTSELSDALKADAGGLVPNLLPELQDLEVRLDIDDAFSTFVETRERAGRLIRLSVPPMQQLRTIVKYVKNIGCAYRKQAMELVSICRPFVQVWEQTPASEAKLRSSLQLVHDALKSATVAGTRASNETDEKFRKAVTILSTYEMDCRPRPQQSGTAKERMGAAKAHDMASSRKLNRLKANAPPIESEPTATVEFLLHNSLPDKNPTIVQQVLCKSSNLKEIRWNFRRFKDATKRLALRKNPHFYAWLPTFPEEYGVKFRHDPIETYLHRPHAKIHVLTDNPSPTSRVYLETSQNTRAFGSVWIPNKAIIFKDVCGRLEGESIVGAAIQDTSNIRYIAESPPYITVCIPIRDWRAPIRRILQHPNVNVIIRIIANPHSNFRASYSALSRTRQRVIYSTNDDKQFSRHPNSSDYNTAPPLLFKARKRESQWGPSKAGPNSARASIAETRYRVRG